MTITLEFLARQQERILAELAELRDDIRVMAAIGQRLDGSMTGRINEVRAEHARGDCLARRIEDDRPLNPPPEAPQ